MIKVVLADDHAMLREGIRDKLERVEDIELAGETGSVAEVLDLVRRIRPDVLVLDIKFKDGSGIQTLQQIKAEPHPCRVVILTMYDHVRYAAHALECGADGYVVKGAPIEELIKAIRTVARHHTYVSSELASQLVDGLRPGTNQPALQHLSAREFEVLIALGNGLSLKECGAQLGISEKSVSTYQARLMQKLRLRTRSDLVRYALEQGLLE